jgi:alkylated DNA repair dioxygenase AlkB
MSSDTRPTWQMTLLDSTEPAIDASFVQLTRHSLDGESWVDHAPAWLAGSDRVFEILMDTAAWATQDRVMYGNVVAQPRLTAGWLHDPTVAAALPILDEMRLALSARYDVDFDSGGLNLYRGGRDSVAWHGDRIPMSIIDPLVAIVSVGHPRRFLLRPKGGGRSIPFELGRGDLLVTGGACQREWQHSVPKVASAGPRVSITFRHSANRPG